MRGLPRLASSAFARRAAIGTYTGAAIALGYALRGADEEQKQRQLPLGWRACCEARALTPAQQALPDKLSAIVGESHVERAVEQRGSRLGLGEAFVVVKPGTLQEAVDALQACVDADACVIPQGANTGLTGGSVPRGAEKGVDRPTVVINMLRMNHIMPIDDGARMVCLAGAGIHSVLQKAASMNKESHSVLGSIFLNPTTAAGIAFGSGGTQVCGAFGSKHMRNVKSHPCPCPCPCPCIISPACAIHPPIRRKCTQLRKGPVYTERLLFARVSAQGKVEVVDTLGVRAGDQQDLFRKLEGGRLTQADVDSRCTLAASQTTYGKSVCSCHGRHGKEISRYNADTHGPDANRSEGKVLILASVHDTFPKPVKASTLWLSVDDFATAQKLKREVCLAGGAADLPVSCEVRAPRVERELRPAFVSCVCAPAPRPRHIPDDSSICARLSPLASLASRLSPLASRLSRQYMDRDSVTAVDEAGRVLCYLISCIGIGSTLKWMW